MGSVATLPNAPHLHTHILGAFLPILQASPKEVLKMSDNQRALWLKNCLEPAIQQLPVTASDRQKIMGNVVKFSGHAMHTIERELCACEDSQALQSTWQRAVLRRIDLFIAASLEQSTPGVARRPQL